LDQPFDRVCSYVVARCRSRKAAPGSEKWISVTSNRTSIFHGRGLANGGYPVESVSRPKGVTRGKQEAKPRAKSSREPGRDGKVARPEKGRFSGPEDRRRSPGAHRGFGHLAMEGTPDRGRCSLFTGTVDKRSWRPSKAPRKRGPRGPFGAESREATGVSEARSCESSRERERPDGD